VPSSGKELKRRHGKAQKKAWERGVIWQAKTIASNAELRE